MEILVVEDEPMVARALVRMVSSILAEKPHSLHIIDDLRSAKDYLQHHKIDLLFLDLNLEGEDGFSLLADIVACPFQTIIVSANTKQAIRAFDYGVVDFVPKPFDQERLAKAIDRLDAVAPIENAGGGATEILSVRFGSKTRLVRTNDIVFIKATDNYSELHLRTGENLLHTKNLRQLLSLLPSRFQRVHKSYLVHIDFAHALASYPGSKYEVRLAGGKSIPVGRSYIAGLRARMA